MSRLSPFGRQRVDFEHNVVVRILLKRSFEHAVENRRVPTAVTNGEISQCLIDDQNVVFWELARKLPRVVVFGNPVLPPQADQIGGPFFIGRGARSLENQPLQPRFMVSVIVDAEVVKNHAKRRV